MLSANRQRWIDGPRELIAEFCSQIAAAVQVRANLVRNGKVHLSAEPESLHQLERLVLTFAKVRLMTDPADEQHRELVRVIGGLLARLRMIPVADDMPDHMQAASDKVHESRSSGPVVNDSLSFTRV